MMTPTFLVALILIASASAADECVGANVVSAPYRVYNSLMPQSTPSNQPDGTQFLGDVWYKINNYVDYSAFTFYSSSATGYILYKATTCDKVNTASRFASDTVGESSSTLPLFAPKGVYYLRIGTTGGSSTPESFEFAFTAISDYATIVNGTETVKTAKPIDVTTGTQNVQLVPFIHLTADVDGRVATSAIDWDSQWFIVTLPPTITRTVRFVLVDNTYPGKDDHSAIVFTFFTTADQSSPSGPKKTGKGLIFEVEVSSTTSASYFLQISRTGRATILTNYNMTVSVQKPVPGPELTTSILTTAQLTTAELTTQSLTTMPLTTAALTTATWDGYGSPGYRWPKPSAAELANFCSSRNRVQWKPHRASNNIGYFCVNEHYYVACQHDDPAKQSAPKGCDVDDFCRCQSSKECSLEGKRSPCGPTKDPIN